MKKYMVDKIIRNKKFVIYLCLTVGWILVVFSFSMQSGVESKQISGGIVSVLVDIFFPQGFHYVELLEYLVRRMAHFTEYFILAVLVLQVLKQTSCQKRILACMLICVLVAGCDETIQLFSGGRSGKVTDVMWDSVGALSGIWISEKVKKISRRVND